MWRLVGFVSDIGMYADSISKEKMPPAHWIFGSAGPSSETVKGVVRLLKTNYPEIIVNFPDLRPMIITHTLFPKLFDFVIDYFPEVVDFLSVWANTRRSRDTQKEPAVERKRST
jgi:hypothetical protein